MFSFIGHEAKQIKEISFIAYDHRRSVSEQQHLFAHASLALLFFFFSSRSLIRTLDVVVELLFDRHTVRTVSIPQAQ
jgi:hypothetical protein